MSETGMVGGGMAARRRELADQGLGEFAAYVAEIEEREWTPSEPREDRPGAQNACCPMTDEALQVFESHFDSFREKTVDEVAAAPACDRDCAPRPTPLPPRPQKQVYVEPPADRGGFDFGAYYDRIGLAREDAVALSRILSCDSALDGAARSGAEDLERLEALLEALELDVELRPEQPSSDQPSNASDAEAEEPAAAVLREAAALLREDAATPDAPVAVLAEEQLVLMLDRDATRRLAHDAARAGLSVEQYALSMIGALGQAVAHRAA